MSRPESALEHTLRHARPLSMTAAVASLAAALVLSSLVAGLVPLAMADDHDHDHDHGDAHPTSEQAAAVVRAISAQLATLERTEAMVDDDLRARRQALGARVRAAYKRVGTGSLPVWASADARKRWLIESALLRRVLRRDQEELVEVERERERLRAARGTLESERQRAATRAFHPPELVLPVADGRTLEAFGLYRHPTTGARLVRRGITVAARAADPVQAPMAGTIRYAGPVRGLGHAVLIEHESGYWALIGHLERDDAVAAGVQVEPGQFLGRASDDAVYLEVRAPAGPAGLPVDPAPLLQER